MTTLEDVSLVEDDPPTDPGPSPVNSSRFFDHRDRRITLGLVLLLLGVYLLTMGGHTYSVDGETYLAGTRALAHGTSVLNPQPDLDGVVVTVPNKNGDATTAAPIGTLILFLPGYVAGRIASTPFSEASQEEVLRLVYLASNAVMTAFTGGLVFLLSRSLNASRRSAVLLALAFGLGTWAWAHSQTDFSEPGTAMLLTAAALAATFWWRKPSLKNAALVGLLIGSTVLTRSSSMVFIPIFLIAGLTCARQVDGPSRPRQAMTFLIGGAGPALLFAANAYIRFGSPFDNGYPPLVYATPVYEGVFGLLLSPGKGLFWYAPICIVSLFALRRSYLAQRRYTLLVVGALVTHLLVYSRFEMWTGENAYGPRYLIPLLPLIVALAAPVIDSGREWIRGARAAAIAGFLVPGLLGAMMYFNGVYWENTANVTQNMESGSPLNSEQFHIAWNFQPRSSPLMQSIRSIPDLVTNSAERLRGQSGGITPIPVPYEDRIHWYARAIELDTWWAWWPTKDVSPFAYGFLLVPAACLAASILLWRSLRRGDVTTMVPLIGVELQGDPLVAVVSSKS